MKISNLCKITALVSVPIFARNAMMIILDSLVANDASMLLDACLHAA